MFGVAVWIAALAVMLASLAGVIFVWKRFGSWVEKRLGYLVTFAGGVFLIVIIDLGQESMEFGLPILELIIWALAGAVFLELADSIIPDSHHHHGRADDHEHTDIDARRMLLGDAVHNIGDGILLVPAFLIDMRLGIATTIAIFLHELVQELAEFFVLREAGYSNKEALWKNFLVSATILLGVAISMLVFSYAESFIGPLTAFAAGGFLFIIVRDLLPHTIVAIKQEGHVAQHVLSFVLGLGIMLGVGLLVPHSHDTDAHTDEHPHAHEVEEHRD